MGKEPLYPHVPKSRQGESGDRDKLIKALEEAASEESDATKMYNDLSDLADRLGYVNTWAELRSIARDEAKHHDALLKTIDAIKSKVLP
ncbi:MAG TPA: ferritin family protein [Dehalococcoidales bacterium]|nr:ferritin family protein [Dehalococcoidales bacterium]